MTDSRPDSVSSGPTASTSAQSTTGHLAAGRALRIGIDARKLVDFGIGTYLWNLIAELGRIDQRNEYLLYHQHSAPAELPKAPKRSWIWDGARKYSLQEQVSLAWHGWRDRLDLLHCPHWVMPLVPTRPTVVTIHDLIHLALPRHSLLAQGYARFMIGHAVRRARRIITVSEFSRQDLIERVGAKPSQVVVIPNGLPPDVVEIRDAQRLQACRDRYGLERPFLLTVGNPRMPHKNLRTLLRAYRVLRERGGADPLLVVAGGALDPAEAQAFRLLAGPYWEDVRIVGFVARADLPALYTAAEAFVWPSVYEGFGIPPLEAMACGTPVVSSNLTAMPEVLGDAALFADPRDDEALADAMLGVLTDSALRQDLVRRGRRRVLRFGWNEHARRTLRVYQEASG